MQAMPQAPGSSAHSCLFHIQLSPPCFDTNTEKRLHYTLNTLHQTLHNTLAIHSKHMSQISSHKSLNSQNSLSHRCLYHITVCHSSADIPPTTSPCSSATKSCGLPYILWLVGVVPFSTNRNMFFACKHLLLAATFVTKACFYRFLHQMRSKSDSNAQEKARQRLEIRFRMHWHVESGGGLWGWASS